MPEKKSVNPTLWSASRIRQLRLRMGYSRAEFARYLEASQNSVSSWEGGIEQPASEYTIRMQLLENQVEQYSERVQRMPVAETLMQSLCLAQIHDSAVVEIALQKREAKKTSSN